MICHLAFPKSRFDPGYSKATDYTTLRPYMTRQHDARHDSAHPLRGAADHSRLSAPDVRRKFMCYSYGYKSHLHAEPCRKKYS